MNRTLAIREDLIVKHGEEITMACNVVPNELRIHAWCLDERELEERQGSVTALT